MTYSSARNLLPQRPSAVLPDLDYLIHLRRYGLHLNLHRYRVCSRLSGNYLSRLHGRGMEFDEVRAYQFGDDPRSIDWQVTARTGRPHTKVFREEKERPVWFLIDYSPAMFFATRGALKAILANEYAALLAWSAIERGDRIGAMILDDQPLTVNRNLFPFRQGSRQVMTMLGGLVKHEAWRGRQGTLNDDLRFQRLSLAIKLAGKGALLILVSDGRFLQSQMVKQRFRQALRHHDICNILLFDPFEARLPSAGILPIRHNEKHLVYLDSDDRKTRERLHRQFQQRLKSLKFCDGQSGYVSMACSTEDAPMIRLQQVFGE
ncbi:MAG: DUF58 domain-containing protein [Gammaproteobacteria bacterium]|nr:MAG: DUF58 domain-containing protein [Gammaproteobacteria bacterium]